MLTFSRLKLNQLTALVKVMHLHTNLLRHPVNAQVHYIEWEHQYCKFEIKLVNTQGANKNAMHSVYPLIIDLR